MKSPILKFELYFEVIASLFVGITIKVIGCSHTKYIHERMESQTLYATALKMSATIRIFAGHVILSSPKLIGTIGTWKICNDDHARLLLKHLYRIGLSTKETV